MTCIPCTSIQLLGRELRVGGWWSWSVLVLSQGVSLWICSDYWSGLIHPAGNVELFYGGKSSDFRSFPPIQGQSATLARSEISMIPLGFTPFGSAGQQVSPDYMFISSLRRAFELTPSLLETGQKGGERQGRAASHSRASSILPPELRWRDRASGGGSALPQPSPPARALTSDGFMWGALQNLFQLQHCSLPQDRELRVAPKCAASADAFWVLYRIRALSSVQMLLFLCFCSLSVWFAYHLFKEGTNWKTYWKIRKILLSVRFIREISLKQLIISAF